MEWWIWITRSFLICFRYSGLYWFIIKKHKLLTPHLPIHVYINRINNRLVFKIKDEYKLELQTFETMKFFGSTKKVTDKTKAGEKYQVSKELK